MAIGDNIPSIFGNLVDSVMKSGGDPQYLMDQVAGENADRNLSLRNAEIDNIPSPFQGSAFDEAMMLTGDPFAATSMTIERSIAESDINSGVHSSNMDNAKIDMAASQMFDMFPGTIDPSLFSTVGDNMDVSADDLAQAWNDINTQVSTEMSMMSPGGEDLINPLPTAPMFPSVPQQNEQPPLEPFEQLIPTGITPSPNPPTDISQEPTSGFRDAFHHWTGLGSVLDAIGLDDPTDNLFGIPWRNDPALAARGSISEGRLTGSDILADRLGNPDFLANRFGGNPYQDQGIIDLKRDISLNNMSAPEADNRIEQFVLDGLDDAARTAYNRGDIGVANSVNREIQIIKAEIDPIPDTDAPEAYPDLFATEKSGISTDIDDPGVLAISQLPPDTEAERLTDGQPELLQAGSPAPRLLGPPIPPPDDTGTITDTGTGMGTDYLGSSGLVAGPGGLNVPQSLTSMTPLQQFPLLMSSVMPNYYTPGAASAINVSARPTYGNFLLRPRDQLTAADDRGDFASFVQATAPQDYNVLDWSKFAPQWNKVLDYVDSVKSGSPTLLDDQAKNVDTSLFEKLSTSPSKDSAISLALSRYYAGQPVPSNYSTRAVANVLSSIYDRKQSADLRTGYNKAGSNSTVNFLDFLATVNPDRFGRN